jgi:hypothetical protein
VSGTVLREALVDYLALRRSLGYALVRDEKLLNQFIGWLDEQGHDRITVDAALGWVRSPELAGASWLRMRMRVVRGFAGWLHAIDPVHEVPPPGLVPGRVARAVPVPVLRVRDRRAAGRSRPAANAAAAGHDHHTDRATRGDRDAPG